jgi:membrane protease YdiL (CAAX protease family)
MNRRRFVTDLTPRRNKHLGAAAVVAVAVFLTQFVPERTDGSGALLAGAFAFGAVAMGLAAVADIRPLPSRSGSDRLRILGVSLAAGCALGILNLMTNYGLAASDARIHERMIEQWTRFTAWSVMFAGPMVEEIGFRLLLMGGAAWLLSQVTPNRRVVFFVALALSAFLFGLAHLLRPTISVVHATGVVLKDSAAGVVLGWVFWRMGLPYSIACHGAANAVHRFTWPMLFS